MDTQHRRSSSLRRRVAVVAAVAIAAVTLAGCASTNVTQQSGGFKEVKQNSKAGITVWVDSTRLPAAQAFTKAYPNDKVSIVTYDGGASGSNSFQTKIELFDKAGSGWPDVVFNENMTDVGWASAGKTPFAAPLNKGIVPSKVINNFAKGALDPCTVNGTVYCLRNDLAQNVLWYNKTLMDKFGYTVPTTWEQYEALGAQLVKDHPGYVLGSVGDAFASMIYFWGSQCPANQLTGKVFSSNTSDPNCTRMATLLDTMIANKSLTTDAWFTGTTYAQKYGKKTLAAVGPSWFGQYLFNDSLKVPAGQMAAAAPLQWAADTTKATGDVGGATWYVSSHSKNIALASKFVQYVTTANAVQSIAPTYPAYAPAAKAWLANPTNSSYFATDVTPAFTTAAAEVWPGWSANGLVNQQNIWAQTVMAKVLTGATITSTLPAWSEAADNLAQTDGYTVKK